MSYFNDKTHKKLDVMPVHFIKIPLPESVAGYIFEPKFVSILVDRFHRNVNCRYCLADDKAPNSDSSFIFHTLVLGVEDEKTATWLSLAIEQICKEAINELNNTQ